MICSNLVQWFARLGSLVVIKRSRIKSYEKLSKMLPNNYEKFTQIVTKISVIRVVTKSYQI